MDPASAIVGFTVVGVQLGATALKLKRLWGQMRDLPDDVEELLASLERVSSLLTRAEPLTSPRRPEAGLLLACLENCQGSRRRLEDMAGELEAKLGRKGGLRRKMMALRTVMNKDLLEKYKSQLRDALHMFSFALEISSNENSHQSLRLLQSEALCSSMRYETLEKHAQNHTAILKSISDQQIEKSLETLRATTSAIYQALEERETQIGFHKHAIETLLSDRSSDSAALQQILHRVQSLPESDPIFSGTNAPNQSIHKDTQTNRRGNSRGIIENILGRIAVAQQETDESWTIRLQTPKWWSGAVYELSCYSQLSSYTFRTYNIVSKSSDIMQSIQTGDSLRVRQLFQTRQASPYDVDANGISLLHYAAYYMHPDICRLLLQRGLGGLLSDPIGKSRVCESQLTPLSMILSNFYGWKSASPDAKRDEVVEVFQHHLRNSDALPVNMAFDYIFELEFNDKRMSLFQDKFMLNHYHRSIEERAESVRYGAFADVSTAWTLRRLLRKTGEISYEDVERATAAHVSLLHSGAICLGRRYGDNAIPFRRPVAYRSWYTLDWSNWVQDMAQVATFSDLHAMETLTPPDSFGQIPQWTGTPLISLIGGMLCWLFPDWRPGVWDQAIQGVLKEWLRALQAGGVNLLSYGMREHAVLHDGSGLCRGAFDADSHRASSTIIRPWLTEGTAREIFTGPEYGTSVDTWRPIRILDIAYGAEPSDWHLLWVVEFEFLAREFWEHVERSDEVMPGSWVE